MSEIFIFSSKKHLTDADWKSITNRFQKLAHQWKSHQQDVVYELEIIKSIFLIIKIISPESLSGCSKDFLFSCIQQLDEHFQCELLNFQKIPIENNKGNVCFFTLSEIRKQLAISPNFFDECYVYNTSLRDTQTFELEFKTAWKDSWIFQTYYPKLANKS